jgi:uncharacterized protein (DUF1800 family)
MLEQLPGNQWTTATAAHLMNRAGFGGSPAAVENLRALGMNGAVSWFIDYEKIPDDTPAPDWAEPDPELAARKEAIRKAADPETRRMLDQEMNQQENAEMADLRYWWLRRMALGPRPFQEKMTLFWHGHFATSFEKVRSPYFLWLQNDTLRQNATGNFNQLLIAVAEDPAMLVYLDGAQSYKAHPNENFAREVMELFTLGEGNYTEKDIQEAAKAYTGWGLSKDQQHYQYHPGNHDDGPKTVFGQTGNFSGEDVLNMICSQPRCAWFIADRIWRFFVQDNPPPASVQALADVLHKSNMDIRHTMSVLFRSREFYSAGVMRAQIKSPVQWLIEAVHQLEAPLPTQPMSLVMLRQLGQELFQPPNVKGWDGGIAWITTNNLLDRYNYAAALVEGNRVPLPGLHGQMRSLLNSVSPDGLLQIAPTNVTSLFSPFDLADSQNFLNALQARFINAELKPQRQAVLAEFLKSRSPIEEMDIRKAIRLIMCMPEYQLT